jgi:hypothetical protein
MSISLFLKKVTTATMGFTTHALEEIAAANQPKAISVLRVWGIVSNREVGQSQYGQYMKFKGEIAALNLVSGEEARSQAVLLPQVAETVVNSLFEKAAKEGGSAQIALEITVEYNASTKGGTKFRYGVKPLIEFKGEDALSVMAKQLAAPVMLNDKRKK